MNVKMMMMVSHLVFSKRSKGYVPNNNFFAGNTKFPWMDNYRLIAYRVQRRIQGGHWAHGPLGQKKFFFDILKKLENLVWPPLCEH